MTANLCIKIIFLFRSLIAYSWSRIKIEHIRKNSSGDIYVYKISINDEILTEIENSTPQEYSNVAVYASNPWHPPANALMKNLRVTTKIEL